MWIIWVVIVVVVLVVIAVIFFVWHFRRQLFSLSSQMARQRVFGGHEMASYSRIRQLHEGIYEFPNAYAFRNEYQEGRPLLQAIQHFPQAAGTFEPEDFAQEEYLGEHEHPVYSDQGHSIPSPTVSEVLLLHEERERQRRHFPTSASVRRVQSS